MTKECRDGCLSECYLHHPILSDHGVFPVSFNKIYIFSMRNHPTSTHYKLHVQSHCNHNGSRFYCLLSEYCCYSNPAYSFVQSREQRVFLYDIRFQGMMRYLLIVVQKDSEDSERRCRSFASPMHVLILIVRAPSHLGSSFHICIY